MHLRRYFYHTLLEDRSFVTPLLLQGCPSYGSKLYTVLFPLVRSLMRKSMRMNDQSAIKSEKRLTDAMEQLNKIYSKKRFLVGNKFSRADFTAASLLAPLCLPEEHDFKWPSQFPEPLISYRKAHEKDPVFISALKMYKEYR